MTTDDDDGEAASMGVHTYRDEVEVDEASPDVPLGKLLETGRASEAPTPAVDAAGGTSLSQAHSQRALRRALKTRATAERPAAGSNASGAQARWLAATGAGLVCTMMSLLLMLLSGYGG